MSDKPSNPLDDIDTPEGNFNELMKSVRRAIPQEHLTSQVIFYLGYMFQNGMMFGFRLEESFEGINALIAKMQKEADAMLKARSEETP